MNWFIQDLIDEAKMGDWMAILLVVLISTVTTLVLWFIFYLADSSFLDSEPANGTVGNKSYSAGYYQAQIISNGKTSTVHQIWIPPTWTAKIDMEILYGKVVCSISESKYNTLNIGDSVVANITVGRFTGNTYCESIQ